MQFLEKEVYIMGNKSAFTLAETLIVLGIIGVVAAITIPTLMSRYREKVMINKLVETYSILSQAYKSAINEHEDPSGWIEMNAAEGMYDENAHKNFANTIKPYLKLANDCVGDDNYAKNHCTPVDMTNYAYAPHRVWIKLLNGTSVAFRIWSPKCDFSLFPGGSVNRNNTCGSITVFLESNKKTVHGLNSFNFYATTEGVIPFGLKGSDLEFEEACNPNNKNPYPYFSSNENMYACAAWVIQNRNMDYFRCPDKLGWDKACKCH